MKFEKSECTVDEHTITSNNVLCCAETGRVVAIFYNDYDLDVVIEQQRKAGEYVKLCIKQQSIEAIADMQSYSMCCTRL